MLSSSSGEVATTTTVLGGFLNTVAVLPISGAGSASNVSVVGGTIDATNSNVAGLAQPITGNHTLTSLDGYFTNTSAMSLVGSTLELRVELWTSSTPDNVFTPVPGASCTLNPSLTGILAIGTVTNCTTTGLSIPIANQTQAILVVRSNVVAGLDTASTLNGYWSAGLTLS
jgi:BclB C-terminal domain-containing protein